MNLFSIYATDVANSLEKRKLARPAHVARLQQLDQQGRLELAGPFPSEDGFSGSLIVAAFDDLAAAQAWANADPYIEAGVYQGVEIKAFKKVLPDA
jgi:uncharacterized protein